MFGQIDKATRRKGRNKRRGEGKNGQAGFDKKEE